MALLDSQKQSEGSCMRTYHLRRLVPRSKRFLTMCSQLCRFRKSAQPGAQKVCSKGLPVHLHGRRYVQSPCPPHPVYPCLPFQLPNTLSCPLGESGLGKSTLINTLFNTTLYAPKETLPPSAERPKTVAIQSISAGMSYITLL